jgi:hypothetical protein
LLKRFGVGSAELTTLTADIDEAWGFGIGWNFW